MPVHEQILNLFQSLSRNNRLSVSHYLVISQLILFLSQLVSVHEHIFNSQQPWVRLTVVHACFGFGLQRSVFDQSIHISWASLESDFIEVLKRSVYDQSQSVWLVHEGSHFSLKTPITNLSDSPGTSLAIWFF